MKAPIWVIRRMFILMVGVSLFWVGSASAASNTLLPDFSLTSTQGQTWSLSTYDGHPKVFMFWATWCPHCKKLFPTIQSLHDKYHNHGLKVVAISVFDEGDTKSYATQRGLTMDVLNNGDGLAEYLQIPGTPTVVVLDGSNQIVFGTVSPDPLDTAIERVVTGLLNPNLTISNTN
ncbi:MAG: redoxin domain-containing protein [Pseudomonadales bacterium]|nr:redoxin domain-containing protein [Pseudomonadales bacterium]